MTTESSAKITNAVNAIKKLKSNCMITSETAINQKQDITAQTRLDVTKCLYLSPSNRARSLSTLMAVDVEIDTCQKIKDEVRFALRAKKEIFLFSSVT